MTLLSTVQDFCKRTGLSSPGSALGSTDDLIIQIIAILEEEGRDLASRGNWNNLMFEASHTTLAAENQGAIATIASNGFKHVKNGTIWDRTDNLPVLGPVDSQDWQTMKAIAATGPRYRYRIRGGKLLVNPTPVAGHIWYFEYVSQNWILGADGVTYKKRFTLDTDTILIPEDLVLLGLRWRWKKEKGFDYAEDFRSYEMQVKDELGHDGSRMVLDMGEDTRGPQPGIFIPNGTWSVP